MLVLWASHSRSPPRSPRPTCTAPLLSQATTDPAPAATSSRTAACPPGPSPATTTVESASALPATASPLMRAASTAAAVPCWSSWKTGMSRRSSSRRWTSKQRGAEMSLRWMPAKTDEQSATASTISAGSRRSTGRGNASMPASLRRKAHLASSAGSDASGPRSPWPDDARAVAHDHHAVALDRVLPRLLEVVVDRHAHAGHARGVGHREVVAAGDRDAVLHPHLAAEVRHEDAVGDRVDRHPDLLERARRSRPPARRWRRP